MSSSTPKTTSNNSSSIPLTDTLCLLEAYTAALSKGNQNLKSCRFNLTKARRQSGHSVGSTVGYSPDELREELYASAVLKCSDAAMDEPPLVDEDGGNDEKKLQQKEEDTFELFLDGIPKQKTTNDNTSTKLLTESTSTGLRQRKNAPSTKDEESKWTTETSVEQKEEMTCPENTNPINLFCGYLPPRSLKASQANSKEALKDYVEAANLVVEMMKLLNQLEKEKKEKEGTKEGKD